MFEHYIMGWIGGCVLQPNLFRKSRRYKNRLVIAGLTLDFPVPLSSRYCQFVGVGQVHS